MADKLTATERSKFAEKFMDLGNLFLSALALGQLVTRQFDPILAAVGIIAFLLMYVFAYLLMKRG
jgi:hypothetical protein